MSSATNRRGGRLGGRFWRLWTAVTVSGWGDGLEIAALPLLAASLSDDPRLVAGVVTAATLPWLVFGLIAGAVVDLSDRRRLMWQVNAVRAALVGTVAVLVATGHMHLLALYALVFLLGVGQTLFETASQAILPDLVAPDQLATANGRRQVGEMIGTTFLGPPAGGLLYAAAAPVPFALDAVTFVVAGGLVASIPGDYAARPGEPRPARRRMRTDIAEGLRWLAGHLLLRRLVVVFGLANLAIFMGEGIFVLFALDELNVSKAGFGLLLTVMAVGGVLGGIVGDRLATALGPARCIAVVLGMLAACHAVVGSLSEAVAVGVVASGVAFASTLWNIVTISLRQRIIPRQLQGRVNSAYRMVGMGAMPVGALLGGVLANSWGLRAPFFVAAAVLAATTALAASWITPASVSGALAGVEASA